MNVLPLSCRVFWHKNRRTNGQRKNRLTSESDAGTRLWNKRQYAAAIIEFETIPESKRNIEIYNTLAYLHLVSGEYQKAFTGFETVLQRDPINMPAFRNLLSLESQLIRRRFDKMKGDILTKVRCTLALTLIRRKQTDAAIEKYQFALKSRSEELDPLLIETGKQLANWFQQYGDTENRETVLRWVEERRGR